MKRVRSLALSLPLTFGLPSFAAAQDQPAQSLGFVHVITVTVQPGAHQEFEAFQKKIRAAAEKIGAPQHWITSYVSLGGPGHTYNIALPFSKWSETDAWLPVPQMLTKAYGQDEATRIMKSGMAATQHTETEVYRFLPELSTRVKAPSPPAPFLHLFVTEVEPAMVPTWMSYLARLRTAQEKAPEAPTAVRWVSALGAGNRYVTVVPFNKFADRDSWRTNLAILGEAFGEAEARSLDESRLRSTRDARQLVLAYRPDLSRPPTAVAAASQ